MRKVYYSSLFFCILLTLSMASHAQNKYNATLHIPIPKPLALSKGIPVDARSYYYDPSTFSYRPYNDTTEVNSYLQPNSIRGGNFPIFVKSGSVIQEWMYKDGTADNDLVQIPIIPFDTTSLSQRINQKLNITDLPAIPTKLSQLTNDINAAIINDAASSVSTTYSSNKINSLISGSGGGTVSSVGITAPSGFQISGSPITSSGTINLSYSSGYSLPTIAKQNSWDAKLNLSDTSYMLIPYVKKGSNMQLPTSYLSANGDTVVSASDTGWDQRLRENGNIVQYKGKYYAFYNGYRMPYTDSTAYCGVAYSTDGVHWTKGGPGGTGRITWYPSEDPYCIIVNDTAYLYTENKGVQAGKHNIILFKSTDMVNFTYSGVAFDLPSDTSVWDSYDVSSPLVIFDTSSNKYYLFYEGIKHTSGISGNASIGIAYSTNPDTFYRFLSTPVIVPGITLKWANNQAVPDDIIHQNGTWYFIGHTQYGNPVISDPYVPFVCSSSDLIHWQDYLGGTIQRNSDEFSDFGDGVMIFNHAGSRSAMYMSNSGDTSLILGNFTNPGFRNDNISMIDYQMTTNVGYYNNGYLIITNIDTSMIGNWVLKMEGNSYNSLTPLNAEIQFSNKSGVNGFSRVGSISTMYNINANLFYYEGKICFWTDGGVLYNQFQYLRFSISGSGILTRIDSVLNAPVPTNILYNTPLSFYNNYYTYRIGSDNNSYYTQFNQANGGTGDLFNINSLNQSIFGFNYSNGTFTSYIPYLNGYYGLALNTGSTSFNQANIRLFINNLGKVGIGTIAPSYLLDVAGNARINLTPPGSAGIDSILVKSASGEISAISPFYYSTPSSTHDSLSQNALDVLFPLTLDATNKTLSADTTMKDSSLVNYRQMKQYVSTNAYVIKNINVATVGTVQLLSVSVGSTAFILTRIEMIQTSTTGTNPTINIGYISPNYSNFFSGTFGMAGQYNTAIPTLSGDVGIPAGDTLYLNITTGGTGTIAVLIEGFYL